MNPILSPLKISDELTLNNRLLLAPVDGVFDRAFRVIAVRFGVGLTCSEMVNPRGLPYSEKLLDQITPAKEERPFQVQLADHSPESFAMGAKMIEERALAEIVDVNMGCPSKRVVSSGNGSALLKSPSLVKEILQALRKATRLDLSVKMRAGFDEHNLNAVEIAKIAEGEGAQFITVHPRTKHQMFGGRADWSIIADVKRAVSIPVVGNGDIESFADAARMMKETGADGVMIARAAFGNPWLIRCILEGDDAISPSLQERRAIIEEHLANMLALFGYRHGVHRFRKQLCWYIKGMPDAARFRKEAMRIEGLEELVDKLRRFFQEAERLS